MIHYSSYYHMLDISEDATAENIKSAYRKLALVCHPDKNASSPESQTQFILITNAYKTLSDPLKRQEYDTYLRSSHVFRSWKKNDPGMQKTLPRQLNGKNQSAKALLNPFNFLLWDIEDLITNMNKKTWNNKPYKKYSEIYILKILAFIDKWVLGPSGYPDYFMEARKMAGIDPRDYIRSISAGNDPRRHRPFVSLSDYFYDIRKRMDRLLDNIMLKDVTGNIPGSEVRLLDSIVEAQNHTIHYLSYLLDNPADLPDGIPPFRHSKTCFEFQD